MAAIAELKAKNETNNSPFVSQATTTDIKEIETGIASFCARCGYCYRANRHHSIADDSVYVYAYALRHLMDHNINITVRAFARHAFHFCTLRGTGQESVQRDARA